MGTKKKKNNKHRKRTRRVRGGDEASDPCTSFVITNGIKDCTGCATGYVPSGVPGKRICTVAKGSAVELRGINEGFSHCKNVIASDNDYTRKGYRPDKKYDCTTCDSGYTPIGELGNRRCEPIYVPIDPNDGKKNCTGVIKDDCTICAAGYVPAGPMFHRRCIKAGQMWEGHKVTMPDLSSFALPTYQPPTENDRDQERERELEERKRKLDEQQDKMEEKQRTQESERMASQTKPMIQRRLVVTPSQQSQMLQRQILQQQRQMRIMKRNQEREIARARRLANTRRKTRFGGTKKRK